MHSTAVLRQLDTELRDNIFKFVEDKLEREMNQNNF